MDSLLLRLATAAALLLACLGAGHFLRRAGLRQAARAAEGIEAFGERKATLLYFNSPFCAVCRAAQGPAVRRFQEAVGGRVKVLEIDVTERPDLAERWGIMSLPTTVVLDRDHRPLAVNPGLATAETLMSQVLLSEPQSLVDIRP